MKVLVTGLCLQGNKGGPAIALALMNQLSAHLGSPQFTFSVPAGTVYALEARWAERYGVRTVADFGWLEFSPLMLAKREKARRVSAWVKALRESDLVVEMSGISYVGPPVGPRRPLWHCPRFRYFLMARLFRRQFLAWTQSYGPFTTRLLRWAARWDLGRQEIVFCRGDDTRTLVQDLLPEKEALSFPDVAVSLPCDVHFGQEYIRSAFPSAPARGLVTVSPSSVIHSKTARSNASSAHASLVRNICARLVKNGYSVLLVPHTYRPEQPDPLICDHALSARIAEQIGNAPGFNMVRKDLSPMELKGIISQATVQIGGRYHSIIAALSSGVPCISLSWHHKYKDIMRMYGVEEYVLEANDDGSDHALFALLDRLLAGYESVKQKIVQSQQQVLSELRRNTELFVSLIRKRPS